MQDMQNAEDDGENPDGEKKLDAGEQKMNWKTMKKILFWWSITLPTAFGFAAIITWILIKTM